MGTLSAQQFFAAVERSHLLNEERLERLRDRLADSTAALDARRVARSLVESEQLTLWQARQLLAGRTAFFLGRYKLLDRIGKGGMGVVFKAEHAVMERVVALKIMSRSLLDNPRARARFTREVKTAAVLHHPNIITAYDADCVGTTHFLVMEFVDGWDLSQWLQVVGPLPVSLACECAMQAAEGLSHAHHQGMVHRDIKPVNLLVAWNAETQRPVVKILDMGLARFISETQEEGGVTRVGHIIGTPDYIAPEAAANFKTADVRADIFSLGCALFKLLTGRLPYGGENTMEKLLARTRQDAPKVSRIRDDIPAELDAIVAKMLAREPDERYQTPGEVAQALAPLAASTLGDQQALELLHRRPSTVVPAESEPLEPDADTSLAEFFLDFTATPIREEPKRSQPSHRSSGPDEELGFAPVDDEEMPVPAEPPRPVEPVKEPKAASKPVEPESPTEPIIDPDPVEPVSEEDPWERLLSEPVAGERPDVVVRSRHRHWMSPGAMLRRLSAAGSRAEWDSPLMLVGGGLLLLLVFGVVLLYVVVGRQSGEQALRLANEDYENGNFVQAIEKYDLYLQRFPRHDGASTARVRRGVAKLRQAVDAKTDWPLALKTAQTVIDEIRTETDFGEAHTELAALLPTIAEGLAAEANAKHDPALVEQAETTLKMINRYVPARLRQGQRMDEVEKSLALTRRTLAQDIALAEAIEAMQEAANQGDAEGAFIAKRDLLKQYPQLAGTPELQEALIAVAEAEREAVSTSEIGRTAMTDDHASPIESTVVLADVEGPATADSSAQPVSVEVAGALYALDSGTGQIRWRRFVGNDNPTTPLAISSAADADWLILDADHNELVRLSSGDGALRWRQPVGDAPTGEPARLGDRVVVTNAAGALLTVDIESGEALRETKLPQALRVGPAAGSDGELIYQLADHSNLYVLLAADGECRQAYYLGHEPGAIRTAPVVVGRYVLLAENHRLHDSRLRVLLLDEAGLISEQVDEIPLEGHVHVRPEVSGRALYVVTDQRAIYRFEMAAPDSGKPLTLAASTPATSSEHVVRYFGVDGDDLWIADNRLTAYEVQSARGRVMPRWLKYEGDVFVAPLERSSDAVFHARRPRDDQGVVVAASRLSDGEPIWETRLGTEPVGGATPSRVGDSIVTFGADGSLYALGIDQLKQRPKTTVAKRHPLSLSAPLSDARPLSLGPARWVLVPELPTTRLIIVDFDGTTVDEQPLDLPEAATAQPLVWSGRLLVPGETGQVYLLDIESGASTCEPFQPRLETGVELPWCGTVPGDGNDVLLADARRKLYRVGIRDEPLPHLVAGAETMLATPLVSPPASTGSWVYTADHQRQLVARDTSDLVAGESWQLDGDVAWGPKLVGDCVLLTTDRNELICCDAAGELRWKSSLPYGSLAGDAAARGEAFVLAATSGVVWRIDAASGEELDHIDLGQPLASGPLVVGSRALVTGMDGCLHCVAIR